MFRTIVLGGARPPADLPANVVTTYGMTETGSGVVYDGVPLEGVDVRIDDDGEILLRGPMLLRAYRDGSMPLAAEGWLPTGDLGAFDDDGRLVVHGRSGELIITGGENVWPQRVEQVLLDAPGSPTSPSSAPSTRSGASGSSPSSCPWTPRAAVARGSSCTCKDRAAGVLLRPRDAAGRSDPAHGAGQARPRRARRGPPRHLTPRRSDRRAPA